MGPLKGKMTETCLWPFPWARRMETTPKLPPKEEEDGGLPGARKTGTTRVAPKVRRRQKPPGREEDREHPCPPAKVRRMESSHCPPKGKEDGDALALPNGRRTETTLAPHLG